jgi:hypothetical protein
MKKELEAIIENEFDCLINDLGCLIGEEWKAEAIKKVVNQAFVLGGVSNWVAISDRKPPKEWSNYMVCLENNSIFQANYCRIGTERWLVVGVGEIKNENPVLYWMEEPKPPCS